jgi:hypothetical protein
MARRAINVFDNEEGSFDMDYLYLQIPKYDEYFQPLTEPDDEDQESENERIIIIDI